MDGFSKLSDIISLFRPDGSTKLSADAHAPDLIVVCSWMSAAPKHIAKYANGYRHLFPDATILLIEARLPHMFLGSDLTAATDFLGSNAENAASDPSNVRHRTVLHAFSNGGGNNAAWLAQRLIKGHRRLPFDRLIFDSCPGQAELMSTTRAITLSLPNQYLVRMIGHYLILLLMSIYKLIDMAIGAENTIARIRRVLNDETIFSTTVPRLYLYSEGDALVSWRDVHDHAEEARRRGFAIVREEKFLKAPHCALLNENSGRYWDAVEAHITGSQ